MQPIFVSGIGTDIGKTVASAVLVESLSADYWKPIQSGIAQGTDTSKVQSLISNDKTVLHPSAYIFNEPVSPHLAAKMEHAEISIEKIKEKLPDGATNKFLFIEGAGGLCSPINEKLFNYDIPMYLGLPTILVSLKYLGSINHSLLSAFLCKQKNMPVIGWIFIGYSPNEEYEIVQWSNVNKVISLPFFNNVNKQSLFEIGQNINNDLVQAFSKYFSL
ncbi:MAG: dethiobiotin synthase [Phycisphaerales bacterium]|nr:dethiobiotin synthase [Phycisphaerales bacterium]